jgi:predicted XRE-type DNA-binding protein
VKSDDRRITSSSGNVFADLGLPDPELRLAKAELSRVLVRLIKERGLTQVQAARQMGLTQPEVSDIVRGRLTRFSMERLERCLMAFDMDIRIQIAYGPTWKREVGVTVELLEPEA